MSTASTQFENRRLLSPPSQGFESSSSNMWTLLPLQDVLGNSSKKNMTETLDWTEVRYTHTHTLFSPHLLSLSVFVLFFSYIFFCVFCVVVLSSFEKQLAIIFFKICQFDKNNSYYLDFKNLDFLKLFY